jgi:hypothetical protein
MGFLGRGLGRKLVYNDFINPLQRGFSNRKVYGTGNSFVPCSWTLGPDHLLLIDHDLLNTNRFL